MKRYNLIETTILMHNLRKKYQKLKSIYLAIKQGEADDFVVEYFLQDSEEFVFKAFEIMVGRYSQKNKAKAEYMYKGAMNRMLDIRKMYSKKA